MDISAKNVFLVFFLTTVLLFQAVTIVPIAFAQSSNDETQIPSWFKTNAKWWNEGKISDIEIVNAIENLLKRGIIKLDSEKSKSTITTPESSSSISSNQDNVRIPSYIKDVFVFWEEGSVSDSDVANAIKFLTEENIIITSSPSTQKKSGKLAAIIDQIYDTIPNRHFTQKAREYLEQAGYDVDIYTTKDITVDLYKKLPSMNYKLIIIRTHSLEEPEVEQPTYLFTGEKYDTHKYTDEQLRGYVSRGIPIYEEELEQLKESNQLTTDKMYFVVGTKLFEEATLGEFPKSTIIIGGCESVRTDDLAKSLISRGASSVVGWNASIGAMENDRVILALLEEMLINQMTIPDAIQLVMEEYGSDLKYSSKLLYIHR